MYLSKGNDHSLIFLLTIKTLVDSPSHHHHHHHHHHQPSAPILAQPTQPPSPISIIREDKSAAITSRQTLTDQRSSSSRLSGITSF
ncbi:hypothetical protein M0802_009234 [Mischocyttarus mexicanus]|nr:hypothetical protein M0802_009234 [Mischocyttarus mexicanus]